MIELLGSFKYLGYFKICRFFNFGTNDLTQTTLGISRDDSGKFLDDYVENNIRLIHL